MKRSTEGVMTAADWLNHLEHIWGQWVGSLSLSWRSPLSDEMWTLLSELSVHLLRPGTHHVAQSQLGFKPRGLQIMLLNIIIILHCRWGPLGHGLHLHPAFLSSHLSCQLYQLVSCLRSLLPPVWQSGMRYSKTWVQRLVPPVATCVTVARVISICWASSLLSSKSSSSALPMIYNVWAIMLQVRVFKGNICMRDGWKSPSFHF